MGVGARPVLVLCVICVSFFTSARSNSDNPEDYAEKYPAHMGVCSMPWRPVLVTSGSSILYGSLESLRELTLTGHIFRIKLDTEDGPYVMNVDNTNVHGDHVCAQSLWHLSDNGTHISTSAEWLYHMVCTDGQVHVITSPINRPLGWSISPNATDQERLQDAKENFGMINSSLQSQVWYVKPLSYLGTPVYSYYLDGSHRLGQFNHLAIMALRGESFGVMRDRGYSFFINNVEREEDEVTGQSLFHVGQRFTPNSLAFHPEPYYWHSMFSTTGLRDGARYYVGTTQPRSHNYDHVALDWHVDSCWEEVYTHDFEGYHLHGSKDSLLMYITKGHRVRARFNNRTITANYVRIEGTDVIIQALEEMARRSFLNDSITDFTRNFFNSDTLWKWSTIQTTGLVRVVTYRVKDMTYFNQVDQLHQITWLVETRPWHKIYSTPPNPDLNMQIADLIDAIKAGASVRLSVKTDSTAGLLFLNADNLRVDEANQAVYAQCLRQVSDEKENTFVLKYRVQANPFAWYVMVSSDGPVAMSAWNVGTRTQNYDKMAPSPEVSWFVSY